MTFIYPDYFLIENGNPKKGRRSNKRMSIKFMHTSVELPNDLLLSQHTEAEHKLFHSDADRTTAAVTAADDAARAE